MKAVVNQEISYGLRLTTSEAKHLCRLLDWMGDQNAQPLPEQVTVAHDVYQALVAQIRIAEGKGSI